MDLHKRMVCPAPGCNFVFWNNPTPVVGVIVEVEEGIILAHNVNWPKGIFSIITGFLESGESPETAAERELMEELGLQATSSSFVGNFAFDQMNQLLIVFHVYASGTIRLNDELDEYKIVSRNRLIGWEESQSFQVGEWLKQMQVLTQD
jgi:NAD+ diphosphatase